MGYVYHGPLFDFRLKGHPEPSADIALFEAVPGGPAAAVGRHTRCGANQVPLHRTVTGFDSDHCCVPEAMWTY